LPFARVAALEPAQPFIVGHIEQAGRDAVQVDRGGAGQHLTERRLSGEQDIQARLLIVERPPHPMLHAPLPPVAVRVAGHTDLVEVMHDEAGQAGTRARRGGLSGATGSGDRQQHPTSVAS
jgi:hypothetical protein